MQRIVAQIPWRSNLALMKECDDPEAVQLAATIKKNFEELGV